MGRATEVWFERAARDVGEPGDDRMAGIKLNVDEGEDEATVLRAAEAFVHSAITRKQDVFRLIPDIIRELRRIANLMRIGELDVRHARQEIEQLCAKYGAEPLVFRVQVPARGEGF